MPRVAVMSSCRNSLTSSRAMTEVPPWSTLLAVFSSILSTSADHAERMEEIQSPSSVSPLSIFDAKFLSIGTSDMEEVIGSAHSPSVVEASYLRVLSFAAFPKPKPMPMPKPKPIPCPRPSSPFAFLAWEVGEVTGEVIGDVEGEVTGEVTGDWDGEGDGEPPEATAGAAAAAGTSLVGAEVSWELAGAETFS